MLPFKLKNLKDPHTPILPNTPHFFWDEMLQNNSTARGYKGRDFNVIEDPGVMKNIIQHALMLEDYRHRIGDKSMVITSGYRPEIYNDVILPANGWDSSPLSDHKCTNSCATDVKLSPTQFHINTWIEVCLDWHVHYNIGLYSNRMHLGWRRDRSNNIYDRR